jgi:hypothetical protein
MATPATVGMPEGHSFMHKILGDLSACTATGSGPEEG